MAYVTIPDMLNDLDLSATEKIALAVINGFCQEDQGIYYGSISFLQRWLGCSRPTAVATLKRLTEKGLLERGEITDKGVKRVTYRVVLPGWLKNLTSKESLPGWLKNLTGGSKEILPNNKIDNKEIINISPIPTRTREERVAEAQRIFRSGLETYRGQYADSLLQAFEDYWAAPLQSPTKAQEKAGVLLQYQTMTSWSLAGRLRTWARKEREYSARSQGSGRGYYGPRLNERGETAMTEAFRKADEAQARAEAAFRSDPAYKRYNATMRQDLLLGGGEEEGEEDVDDGQQ